MENIGEYAALVAQSTAINQNEFEEKAQEEQAEVEKDILTYNSKVAQSQKMEEANFARMQGQVAKNEAKIAEYGYYAKAGTSLLRMGGYTV